MKNAKTTTDDKIKAVAKPKSKNAGKKDSLIGIDQTPVSQKLAGKTGHGIIPEGGNVGYDAHKS